MEQRSKTDETIRLLYANAKLSKDGFESDKGIGVSQSVLWVSNCHFKSGLSDAVMQLKMEVMVKVAFFGKQTKNGQMNNNAEYECHLCSLHYTCLVR